MIKSKTSISIQTIVEGDIRSAKGYLILWRDGADILAEALLDPTRRARTWPLDLFEAAGLPRVAPLPKEKLQAPPSPMPAPHPRGAGNQGFERLALHVQSRHGFGVTTLVLLVTTLVLLVATLVLLFLPFPGLAAILVGQHHLPPEVPDHGGLRRSYQGATHDAHRLEHQGRCLELTHSRSPRFYAARLPGPVGPVGPVASTPPIAASMVA